MTTGAAVIRTLPSSLTSEKFSALYDDNIDLLRVSDINPIDQHPNHLGQKMLGDGIHRFLVEQKLGGAK